MSGKFARCFPLPDGNVCCEHWNGNYIVFPGYGNEQSSENEKTSKMEEDSEE